MKHSNILSIIFLFFVLSCDTENVDYYIEKERVGAVLLSIQASDTSKLLTKIVRKSLQDFPSDLINHRGEYYKPAVTSIHDSLYIRVFYHLGIRIYPGDYYFELPGVLSVVRISDSTFLAVSTIGEAVFNYSDYNSIKPVSFRYISKGVPDFPDNILYKYSIELYDHDLYFECPGEDQDFIYGWVLRKTKKANCYVYMR